jgi:hypothetical protein
VRSFSGFSKKCSGAHLDYAAPVHEDHPVGHAPCETHLVGYDDHRHAAPRQIGHRLEHLVDHLWVERARGLVEEYDLGLHRKPARYGHALLLAPERLSGYLSACSGMPTRSRWREQRSSASLLEMLFTFMGVSFMFSATVMCG